MRAHDAYGSTYYACYHHAYRLPMAGEGGERERPHRMVPVKKEDYGT